MSQILSETAISIPEVVDHLPRRRGKKMHPSSAWRWALKGRRGIKLESILVGGVRMTSVEAIGRFVERLSQSSESESASLPTRTPAQRRRASEAAAKELERLGC